MPNPASRSQKTGKQNSENIEKIKYSIFITFVCCFFTGSWGYSHAVKGIDGSHSGKVILLSSYFRPLKIKGLYNPFKGNINEHKNKFGNFQRKQQVGF